MPGGSLKNTPRDKMRVRLLYPVFRIYGRDPATILFFKERI